MTRSVNGANTKRICQYLNSNSKFFIYIRIHIRIRTNVKFNIRIRIYRMHPNSDIIRIRPRNLNTNTSVSETSEIFHNKQTTSRYDYKLRETSISYYISSKGAQMTQKETLHWAENPHKILIGRSKQKYSARNYTSLRYIKYKYFNNWFERWSSNRTISLYHFQLINNQPMIKICNS